MRLKMKFNISLINWLEFLSRRKVINIAIVLIYFIIVVLPHKWFGNRIVDLFTQFSRQTYQLSMLIIALVFIAVYLFIVYRLMRKNYSNYSLIFLVILLVLTILSYPLLIIHYVETIHFLQYAILAFLLIPLCRNYYKLMFWGLILAFFDEAYQYFYLAVDDTPHYDFNDIILNQLGLAYGVFPVSLKGNLKLIKCKFLFRNILPELIIICLIILMFIILSLLNVLSIYPDDTVNFNLVKELPGSFLTEIKHLKINYHIVLPFEGMVIIALLYFYFCRSLTIIHIKSERRLEK